jgi:hypothetical protein
MLACLIDKLLNDAAIRLIEIFLFIEGNYFPQPISLIKTSDNYGTRLKRKIQEPLCHLL